MRCLMRYTKPELYLADKLVIVRARVSVSPHALHSWINASLVFEMNLAGAYKTIPNAQWVQGCVG